MNKDKKIHTVLKCSASGVMIYVIGVIASWVFQLDMFNEATTFLFCLLHLLGIGVGGIAVLWGSETIFQTISALLCTFTANIITLIFCPSLIRMLVEKLQVESTSFAQNSSGLIFLSYHVIVYLVGLTLAGIKLYIITIKRKKI